MQLKTRLFLKELFGAALVVTVLLVLMGVAFAEEPPEYWEDRGKWDNMVCRSLDPKADFIIEYTWNTIDGKPALEKIDLRDMNCTKRRYDAKAERNATIDFRTLSGKKKK